MDDVLIIAFTGKLGSGKSTLAGCLEDVILDAIPNPKVEVLSFATPVYSIARILANVDEGAFYDKAKIINNPLFSHLLNPTQHIITGRQLLQKIGTEVFRSLNPDIWLNILENKVEKFSKKTLKTKVVIIDDLRFNNEAQWVKRNNGIILLVKEKEETGPEDLHSSEFGINSIYVDLVIENIPNQQQQTAQQIYNTIWTAREFHQTQQKFKL